jgi:large subunit ribosomal protein L22e
MGKSMQKKSAKKTTFKYTINCSEPLNDNVLVLDDFLSFITQKVKVAGKTGNLGNSIAITKDGQSLVVEAKIPFSKRYLKYLSKKYLKKQDLREYLRVIATSKTAYELRFFQVNGNEEEAE